MDEAAPQRDYRAIMAHVFMCAFVLFTALGIGIALGVGWGFLAAGLASFVYGFLLGQGGDEVVEVGTE